MFDLDGTLIDSRRDIAASANAALRALGLPERPLAEVTAFVGHGARNLILRCVEPRVDMLEPALAAWMVHYGEHLLDTTVAYEGVPELLESLSRLGDGMAVVTNKPGRFARRICEALFPGRFAVVLGGDEGPRKPDPGLLLEALQRAGVPAREATYVGDMDLDEDTAAAAGTRFLGAAWGFGGLRPGSAAAARPLDLLSVRNG